MIRTPLRDVIHSMPLTPQTTKKPPRTRRAMAAVPVRSNGESFAKPDELVKATLDSRGLSLPAHKALNLMIAKAAGDAWRDQSHKISRGELRAIGNMPNAEIMAILDEMAAVRFHIEGTSDRGRAVLRRRPMFRILDEEQSDADDDEIVFEFDPTIRKIMATSEHYTALITSAVLAFDSKYAARLYEIGSRQARIGEALKVSPDKLRQLLGVPEGKMKGWNDFRRFVLDKAQIEVNQVADFTMDWRADKHRGRVVTQVSIAFVEKDAAGKAEAAAMRTAHRSVRRGRRKGAEIIIEDPSS